MRPKVASHYLLEKMKRAGVSRTFIVLRNGKWDIPAYWGDGTLADMHLAYLVMRVPYGPPYTLDQAYPFTRATRVVFGFPDILFQPDNTFVHLLARQESSHADMVLGLFPAHDNRHMDMVDIDHTGQVREVFLKPLQSRLTYAWICAVWTPVFSQFMHDYLTVALKETDSQHSKRTGQKNLELTVGAVIQAAVQRGLQVEGITFATGSYVDIGTPDGLLQINRTPSDPSSEIR
jgi:glucose-1-phosphate thymidylyltransferase